MARTGMPYRTALAFALAAAVCATMAMAQAAKAGVSTTYTAGPHSLEMSLDKSGMTVAQSLHLALIAHAAEGYAVKWPAIGEKLGGFAVARRDELSPALQDDGRVQHVLQLTLRPFLAGDYPIPPMDIRISAGANTSTITTDAITIQVDSVLSGDPAQANLIEEVNPYSIIAPAMLWPWALGAVALAILGFGIWRFTRKPPAPQPETPAHLIALREIDLLLKDHLFDRGEYKMFYLRISNIVRHFIERRFDLHAPEQTTEEFLDTIKSNGVLTDAQKGLLKEFLTYSDLVKFAKLQPTPQEAQDTCDACRRFILESAAPQSQTARTTP